MESQQKGIYLWLVLSSRNSQETSLIISFPKPIAESGRQNFPSACNKLCFSFGNPSTLNGVP